MSGNLQLLLLHTFFYCLHFSVRTHKFGRQAGQSSWEDYEGNDNYLDDDKEDNYYEYDDDDDDSDESEEESSEEQSEEEGK